MEKFISGGMVESHPGNINYITFHMRHELTKPNGWYSTEHHDDNGMFMGGIGECEALPLTITTVKAIAAIPGIKSVSARHYTFGIEKADAFSWDELYPKIKLAMSKYLPAIYA